VELVEAGQLAGLQLAPDSYPVLPYYLYSTTKRDFLKRTYPHKMRNAPKGILL